MLPSCLPCTICKSGEEERTPCTATKDTQCQCKPGTFHEEDSPEFCQKCSTGCPDGMVVAKPCNPFSDLKCVDQKSDTQASGEALVPGKTVTMSRRLPTTPSPSSGNSQLEIGIVTAGVLLLLVPIAYVFWRFFIQGYGVDPKCMDRVSWFLQDLVASGPQGPGALDNAHNNMLINRDLLSILVAKKDLEDQEQDKLTGVTVQSPVEAKHL
ncbi:hypothetical protein EI555_020230, partial [Monodon monoceros]